jgi:hypothetical protein
VVPPRSLGLVQTCWPASIVALSPTEALVVGVDAYDFSLTGSPLWWSAWDGSRDVVYHVASTSPTCRR